MRLKAEEVLFAEKESADSRVCAVSPMGAVEVLGRKTFLSWHFCELCFCQMVSSLWPDSARVKSFLRTKEFVMPFERGAKKSLHLEVADHGNPFVLWTVDLRAGRFPAWLCAWAPCVAFICELPAPSCGCFDEC